MKTEIYAIADTRTIKISQLIARRANARMAYAGDTILVGDHLWQVIDVLIEDQVQVIKVRQVSSVSDSDVVEKITGDLWERLGVKMK